METDILEISSQVNDEFTLMSLFFRADLVVKLVILMLFAASIFSWAIIIQKIRLFRNIKKLSEEFDAIFWSGKSIKEIQAEFLESESFPVKNVFDEALKEIKKSESEKSIASLPDRLDTVIESSIDLEGEKLSSLFNYLATIGSTSPFIGLFGTVWGIMNSFQSIAISKNTSLAVVAPGIAEALFATALGLLAAIPAVIAYNLFTGQVNKEVARMYRFKDQFKNIFLRGLDKKKVNWFYFMPRNIKSKPFSEINVTPFVDVMLVLLIIFMVTAPLLTVGVQVDLPESNADSLQADNEPLELTISKDGSIFIQETEINIKELIPKLIAITDNRLDTKIYVRGDEIINYGIVMRVLGELSGSGFSKVALITKPITN